MENEFVPYKEALALKELGFDKECLAYYTEKEYENRKGILTNFNLLSSKISGELVGHGSVKNSLFSYLKNNDRTSGELYILSNSVTAPLYQQAFDWFRKNHNLESSLPLKRSKDLGDFYGGYIIHKYDNLGKSYGTNYKTYEKARLGCLKKLIEIVKNK
jgi:hypothetical protein